MDMCIGRIFNYQEGIVVLGRSEESDGSFWLVPMTGSNFEEWWASQDTLFRDPDGGSKILAAIFNEEPPLIRSEPFPGEFIYVRTEEERSAWEEMDSSRLHYSCVLCCNSDSYLEAPDGRRIYHRGYTGETPPNKAW